MHLSLLLREFFQDIRTQKLRAFLTIMAVTWGTLAVILLMAFGEGLGHRVSVGMRGGGNRCIRIYGGQTRKIFEGLPVGRTIHLHMDDYYLIKQSIQWVDRISPQLGRRVNLRLGDKISSTYMEGVYPDFEYLRAIHPGPGSRFINDKDIIERRRAVFFGETMAEEMFGKGTNPLGKTIELDGIPFTVIGIMPKKMQMGMSNGPDDRRAIIPFSTFQSIYSHRWLGHIIVSPVSLPFAEQMMEDIRELMGNKYRFDPTDEDALNTWDHIENEKTMEKMFLGINIFLGVLGAMSLIVAGVGIANIMYVVARERTQEIGIKRAIGAKKIHIIFQFIFESLLMSGIGGVIGILISVSVVRLMWSMPADEGVMSFLGRPELSGLIVFISISILTLIGILAGFLPARKAANVDPIEALRYE